MTMSEFDNSSVRFKEDYYNSLKQDINFENATRHNLLEDFEETPLKARKLNDLSSQGSFSRSLKSGDLFSCF